MKITLKTDAWAAIYLKERTLVLDMPEGSTVFDAITAAKIPEAEAGITVINGKAVPKKQVLSDGAVIKVHPIIVGG